MNGHDLMLGDSIEAGVIRNAENLLNASLPRAVFDFELFRAGKLIDKWKSKNLVTNEGQNALLDVMFSGGTQISTWYVVCFEDNHSPAAGDTYAVPGYTETTAYNEANRPTWTEAGVSSQSITNSANKATFTFNASKTIYGAALVGGGSAPSTKGNTAGGGKLYSLSSFSSSKAVQSGDVLNVTVTLSTQVA